jgi:hypothetical protein
MIHAIGLLRSASKRVEVCQTSRREPRAISSALGEGSIRIASPYTRAFVAAMAVSSRATPR